MKNDLNPIRTEPIMSGRWQKSVGFGAQKTERRREIG